jgi:hypothetical protein
MCFTEGDFGRILGQILPLAKSMLQLNRGFHPYACVVLPNGQLDTTYANGTRSHQRPIIYKLQWRLDCGLNKGRYRAGGIVYQGTLSGRSSDSQPNAVAVRLTHLVEPSTTAVFPYRVDGTTVWFTQPFECSDSIHPAGST